MKKKINTQRLKEQLRLGGVALALALIVWVIAKAGETREARLTVPVEVTSLGPQVQAEVIPSEISVLVRYGNEASRYISSDYFKFVIDGTNMQENLDMKGKEVTLSLSEKNWVANIPSARVDVAQIGLQSSTVRVRLSYNAVPAIIQPNIVGMEQLPEGYQLVSPVKVSPREVYLIGDSDKLAKLPRDEMSSRVQLMTTPLSVAGRTESGLETVEILLDPGVSLVQRNSNLAEVNIEIQEVQTVREMKNIPLEFQALAPDTVTMKYAPKTATVRAKGPQSVLRQLSPENFRVNLVRPPEEVPGTTLNVPLEVHFAPSVSDDVRSRVSIQGIEPSSLEIEYLAREAAAAAADMQTTSTGTTTSR